MKVIINNKKIELILAKSFFQRLKGLMFQKNINYCLRIKTNSIHTIFMKENIDIIMTDKNNNVLYIFKNVPKNKIIIKKNIYYTYEFPNNFIDKNIKKIKIQN
ncbi:MAG: DUF192 domain-containing protein [Bacilli bacterium]|nr:DUF192 domain-containing protein [Bacilli bacterium]